MTGFGNRADGSPSTQSLDLLARQAVDYRRFGVGAAGINDAIEYMNDAGGGRVIVPADTPISAQIVGKDKVQLVVPRGRTITLTEDLGSDAMVRAEDAPDFQVTGGGVLKPAGLAPYALRISGASNFPIDGIEITDHKGGARIEANATAGIGNCVINGLYAHTNYVHPTDPTGQSEAGHYLSVSCRPSLGYALTESVILNRTRLIAATAGAYTSTNQFSRDLCSIQGGKVVWINDYIARNSGEIGLSVTFGPQQVSIQNARVEYSDGHGIVVSGAHYMLDVTGATGDFTVGETVRGGTSGATGVVEYWIAGVAGAGVLWLKSPSRTKMADTETITGGTSTETATVATSWAARKSDVHREVYTRGNGIDASGAGTSYSGAYAQHVEQATAGGTHEDNKPWGIAFNSCDFQVLPYHCPVGATQTIPLNLTGSSTHLGTPVGPVQVDDPGTVSGNSVRNFGFKINPDRQLVGVGKAQPALILNRTDDGDNEELGDVIEIRANGTLVASVGTDTLLWPLKTATGAFSHTDLNSGVSQVLDPADYTRKFVYSTNSRAGAPSFLRSDGARWIDQDTGLPTRSGAWDDADLETELDDNGAPRAFIYVSDGVAGIPALCVLNGNQASHLYRVPLIYRAGGGTISNGASSEAIVFNEPFPAAIGSNFAAIATAKDSVAALRVSAKARTGITVARTGTSGDEDFDYLCYPYWDPTEPTWTP